MGKRTDVMMDALENEFHGANGQMLHPYDFTTKSGKIFLASILLTGFGGALSMIVGGIYSLVMLILGKTDHLYDDTIAGFLGVFAGLPLFVVILLIRLWLGYA